MIFWPIIKNSYYHNLFIIVEFLIIELFTIDLSPFLSTYFTVLPNRMKLATFNEFGCEKDFAYDECTTTSTYGNQR